MQTQNLKKQDLPSPEEISTLPQDYLPLSSGQQEVVS